VKPEGRFPGGSSEGPLWKDLSNKNMGRKEDFQPSSQCSFSPVRTRRDRLVEGEVTPLENRVKRGATSNPPYQEEVNGIWNRRLGAEKRKKVREKLSGGSPLTFTLEDGLLIDLQETEENSGLTLHCLGDSACAPPNTGERVGRGLAQREILRWGGSFRGGVPVPEGGRPSEGRLPL